MGNGFDFAISVTSGGVEVLGLEIYDSKKEKEVTLEKEIKFNLKNKKFHLNK